MGGGRRLKSRWIVCRWTPGRLHFAPGLGQGGDHSRNLEQDRHCGSAGECDGGELRCGDALLADRRPSYADGF